MFRTLLALPLLAAGTLATAEPPEFGAAPERFSNAADCQGHLQQVVTDARAGDFDAAEGPYPIGPADVRAHTVRAEAFGHRISEYRCEGAQLSTRSWVERMERREAGAYSIDSLAGAQWLEQGSRQ